MPGISRFGDIYMIKLAGIFKDGAVLQRDKDVIIFGHSDGEVTATLFDDSGKIVKSVKANLKEGNFEANIGSFSAGGPYSLRLEDPDGEKVISDLYFGDVWIAGGQSNMELELQNSKNGAEAVAQADNSRIRFYYTPKVAWLGKELEEAEGESTWQKCSPENVACWSAVGYYFAQALTEEIEDVMIGIIGCNWGGTSATAWTGREKLAEHPETKAYLDKYDEAIKGISDEEYERLYEEYVVYQAEFDKNVGNYYMTNPNPSWEEAISLFGENKYPGPMGPKNWSRPAGLHETMIMRIAPYTVKGCIYYQGEDDDNRPYSYNRVLTSMLEQWREDFRDEKLPFIIVQLPIFVNEGETDDKNWPFIREAQAEVAKTVGNGLAVILEAGEYHNIHPLDKETVGYRLAYQALYNVYGYIPKWEACGPEYDSSFSQDNAIYVDLKCCEQGLMVNGDDMFLEDVHMQDYLPDDSGFEIAGADGVYYPARAQVLRGETINEEAQEDPMMNLPGSILSIKLTSDKVDKPVFARYFWTNFAKVRIFGANGIPLAPFRTSKNDGARAIGSRQGEIYD